MQIHRGGLGPFFLALTCAAALSCNLGGAPDGVIDRCTGELSLPPAVSTDVLFVIDNSGSMSEEQAKVAAELQTFVDALAHGPVQNDFQVGVVTTGVTLNGRACGGSQHFISYPAESGRLQRAKDLDGQVIDPVGPRVLTWDAPELVADFGALVGQGIRGSGQEMGLEAAWRAVSEPLTRIGADADPPGNAGFLRPGSRLLVVVVSDEDDCSDPTETALAIEPPCGEVCDADDDCGGPGNYCVPVEDGSRRCQHNACETAEGRALLAPVDEYVRHLQGLDDGTGTGRLREVFLAVIGAVDAGGQPLRCRSATDEAQGVAVRYAQAVAGFGENGFLASICDADYGPVLERIADLVGAPQILDLPESPPDGRLLRIKIRRADGSEVTCNHGDGFTFEPAIGAAPARVVMEGACRLRNGDTLDLDLICAG